MLPENSRKIVFLIPGLVLAIGAVFYFSDTASENPPQFSFNAALYEGKAGIKGLIKFDDYDKYLSNQIDRNAQASSAVTRSGVNFYYVENDLPLLDLVDPAKCINANVGRALFFTYSPGGESQTSVPGFYLYPGELASGGNHGIYDPGSFVIKRG